MNFIYLTAAIQSVPSELYESVALDGANFFQKHRHVTIPSISPTLYEIYQEAFINSRFGVACAESVVLFVILIILTALQFRLEKKVTY